MRKYEQVMELIAARKLEEACVRLERLVRRNPRDVKAWFLLGAAHGNCRRVDQAIQCASRVVKIDPEHVDAHFNLAQGYLHKKQYLLAVQHYREVVKRQPDHFDAHHNMAAALAETGAHPDAVQHLREAVRIRPESQEARFFLAALDKREAPPAPPARYVRSLFDGYADKFDAHLVDELKYRIPERLRDLVGSVQSDPAAGLAVADLGCGTGLCAPLFRGMASRLDGVDLAPKMVEKARVRNLYDHLEAGDLVAFLAARPVQYDLIIAADVLVYLGDLGACFEACRQALRPNGLFVFSAEALPPDSKGFALGTTYRYKHSRDYLLALAAETGFSVVRLDEAVIRLERGQPVSGFVVALRAGPTTA